ncbi:DJ-1 family glyoxalase III [Sulfurospirillum barnesii]|uniref:DJ-1 family protein n=1 Tax=Sulfurospirillum barnesii (strain ATCC 700032 / DSM 10660 / SES-3) TaxID=760154 RepID=I3XVL2_SULBS|nr:DJ-1 family glyoxalase III [Sulfurospirillum barnesii]AFL67986.1 DJ-1 family protein [Sulfurospirillum barnesii SES-3]
MSKKVLVPFAEGFEEIEALSIVDILRRAKIEVTMAALTSLHVKGAHGVVVVADALISELDATTYDMIALPGGLPGATNLAKDATLQAILKAFDAKGKGIAAICAAPYALYTAGVLKKRYTCYPGFHSNIAQDGYTDADKVVRDENITTSQGPSTAMLFALALVEQLCGKELSEQLAKELLLK